MRTGTAARTCLNIKSLLILHQHLLNWGCRKKHLLLSLCSVVKRNCLCIWQAGKSWNIWLLDGKSSSECEPKKWHSFMCYYIEIQVQAILTVFFQKPRKFSAFPVSWITVHFWETNLSVTFLFTIIIFLEEKWFHGVLLGLSAGRNNESPFAIL